MTRKAPAPGTCEITAFGGGSLIVCGDLCSIRDLVIIAKRTKANERAKAWRERRRATPESQQTKPAKERDHG